MSSWRQSAPDTPVDAPVLDERLQTFLFVARRLRAGRGCQILIEGRPWVVEPMFDEVERRRVFVAREAANPDATIVRALSVASLVVSLRARAAARTVAA